MEKILTKEIPAQIYNDNYLLSSGDKIDVLYCSHNRLEYTKITFPKVLEQCQNVRKLWIRDDASIDGTFEFIESTLKNSIAKLKCQVDIKQGTYGNSVDQMNELVEGSDADFFIKIDNDILIPEDYVATLYRCTGDESLFCLMMSECSGIPFIKDAYDYVYRPAGHIGGVGIFRASVMRKMGPIPTERRFFGFTGYQQRACRDNNMKAGQMTQAANMNLDLSCYSRAKEYTKKGWSRMFSVLPYDKSMIE